VEERGIRPHRLGAPYGCNDSGRASPTGERLRPKAVTGGIPICEKASVAVAEKAGGACVPVGWITGLEIRRAAERSALTSSSNGFAPLPATIRT